MVHIWTLGVSHFYCQRSLYRTVPSVCLYARLDTYTAVYLGLARFHSQHRVAAASLSGSRRSAGTGQTQKLLGERSTDEEREIDGREESFCRQLAASREQCHPSFWQSGSGPAIFRIAP
ncbi:hypothetical protein K503DRAFT_869494 [Rhizopogon vinicolor AM-OR11-026]|uniref:Uncharacterized protein n=1 Tax=Rhizopogon vinicolor AM-OR11-026 TaxID=1314800 RepID=A0A1B7MLS9_9AGAM|nr:hypothetical protein K503DRAFT_869494 [Rhizopogon vinicolor AM-OR11-026]